MELQRLTRLGRVTRDLNGATDLQQVTEIVVGHAAAAVSAAVAMLALREGDEMRTLGLRGQPLIPALARGRFPLAARVPICDAVRTGEAVMLLDRESILEAYPHLTGGTAGAMLAFPLRSGTGEVLGALALRFDEPGIRPDMAEIELLSIVADVCTQTLLRLQAEARSAERLRRIEFLSAASEELAGSLDHKATLTTVAKLAARDFAQWCGVQLREGDRLTSLVVAHSDPEKAALVHDLLSRVPRNPNAMQGAYRVLRSGVSELHSPITPEALGRTSDSPEFAALADRLGLRSAMVVPLTARGRILGTMSLASSDRLFDEEDVEFAEDLARRAAVAIDNAGLFSQAQRAAQTLQHALLPQRLPELKGWDIATLYQPSGRAEVGGDFFDVIALSPGRHLVAVGDVMGRGVDAAAIAARTQAAVRTLVAADSRPGMVAAGLDRLFEMSQEEHLVTMVLLVFDQVTDTVDVLVAGHPPPYLVGTDGRPVRWRGTVFPAFGVGTVDRYAEPLAFSAGDTMLLFTDGLVERRDEDLDVGLDRLAAVVDHSVPEDREHLETFLERVARRMRPPARTRHDDDVTMLAVRRLE